MRLADPVDRVAVVPSPDQQEAALEGDALGTILNLVRELAREVGGPRAERAVSAHASLDRIVARSVGVLTGRGRRLTISDRVRHPSSDTD